MCVGFPLFELGLLFLRALLEHIETWAVVFASLSYV